MVLMAANFDEDWTIQNHGNQELMPMLMRFGDGQNPMPARVRWEHYANTDTISLMLLLFKMGW